MTDMKLSNFEKAFIYVNKGRVNILLGLIPTYSYPDRC